jgi:hypothetical protein
MSRRTLGLLLVLAFTFGLLAVGTLSAQDDLLYPIGEGSLHLERSGWLQ